MDRADFPEFYKKNVGLIRTAARKASARAMAVGSGTLDYDELEQELTEVFIRAYDCYDPSQFKFSTYFMRAAFNRANHLINKVCVERLENGTRSVEEMGSWLEDEEVGLTVEDVTSLKPEEHAQLQSLLRDWHAKLTPAAQAVMSLTLEPPEWLCDEFLAQQAYADLSRAFGVAKRSRQEINASYVVQVLKKTCGEGQMFDQALAEVQKIARNTL